MLKVAVVGAGNMARCHMDVAAHLNDVEIVGICSRGRERAAALAEKYGVKIVANSISELFSSTKPDGVIIAVSETSTEEGAYRSFHVSMEDFGGNSRRSRIVIYEKALSNVDGSVH